jgi:hypothetical protein
MADDVIDFLRIQFARVNQRLDSIAQTQTEHGHRLSRIELAVASLRRDQAIDAEGAANQSARIDTVVERLDRIERRLDIATSAE